MFILRSDLFKSWILLLLSIAIQEHCLKHKILKHMLQDFTTHPPHISLLFITFLILLIWYIIPIGNIYKLEDIRHELCLKQWQYVSNALVMNPKHSLQIHNQSIRDIFISTSHITMYPKKTLIKLASSYILVKRALFV